MAIVQESILGSLKFIVVLSLLLIFSSIEPCDAQEGESKIKKIAIDAGHGGKDPGACGRLYYEKDIVLGVALRLGRLIEENLPEIKVIYTRKKDVFLEVWERSEIANKEESDLFISIHANAHGSNNEVIGYETYVMGLDKSSQNMEVAMRENAVIKYETGYEERYDMFDPDSPESYIIFSLMQNTYLKKSIEFAELVQNEIKKVSSSTNRGVKQAPFLVLWKTMCPSVLIEIGFISNITEEEHLGDIDIQQQIAESIFNAVKKYIVRINGLITNIEISKNNKLTNDTLNNKSKFPKSHSIQNTNGLKYKDYKWITE